MTSVRVLVLAAALGLLVVSGGLLWWWEASGRRAASLAGSDDPEKRQEAVRELRGKNTAPAREALADLTDDPDPDVARQAVRVLADFGDEAARARLGELIDSDRPDEIRGEAVAALGRLGDRADLDYLIEILSDTRRPTEVRVGAARAIGRLGENRPTNKAARQALPALVAALSDAEYPVRAQSIAAIYDICRIVRFPQYDPRKPTRRAIEIVRSSLRESGWM